MTDQRFRPLATFSGLRQVPLIATSHNSIYPSLTVTFEGVTLVVVRAHRFAWSEIEAINARWLFGHMITIVPKGGWRTFSATFYGRPAAANAVRALQAAGAPLAPSALAWLT
ncbi:MAG: hypothetical protein Q8M31_19190 [Beijerinckiaceae bacterium]|nr:hypothetical protein [Beijerinckiaceae bacterium]